MLAVRGEPRDINWAASAQFCRPDRKHVFLKVQSVRMICRVHGNRVRIVIDGDIDGAAKRFFQREAGAAATCEIIDYQAHYSNPPRFSAVSGAATRVVRR